MTFPIKNPKRITGIDSRIFASLAKAQRPLPVKQIANRVNVTWSTANKHVELLRKLKVLQVDKTIRKNRITIDPKFIIHLKNKGLIKKEMGDAWKWAYE